MRLDLVLWNCNGPQEAGAAGDRLDAIESVTEHWRNNSHVTPHVVLAQEVTSRKVDQALGNSAVESVDRGEREATVYIYSKLEGLQRVTFLDQADLIRIYDLCKKRQQLDGIELARLHCSVLTLTSGQNREVAGSCDINEHKLLLVSWHGPSRVSAETKANTLLAILRFLEAVRSRRQCQAVLFGGDFNMTSDEASKTIKDCLRQSRGRLYFDPEVFADYPLPDCRPKILDYIIAWPKEYINSAQAHEVQNLPRNLRSELSAFDHALIQYSFRLFETAPQDADVAEQFPKEPPSNVFQSPLDLFHDISKSTALPSDLPTSVEQILRKSTKHVTEEVADELLRKFSLETICFYREKLFVKAKNLPQTVQNHHVPSEWKPKKRIGENADFRFVMDLVTLYQYLKDPVGSKFPLEMCSQPTIQRVGNTLYGGSTTGLGIPSQVERILQKPKRRDPEDVADELLQKISEDTIHSCRDDLFTKAKSLPQTSVNHPTCSSWKPKKRIGENGDFRFAMDLVTLYRYLRDPNGVKFPLEMCSRPSMKSS